MDMTESRMEQRFLEASALLPPFLRCAARTVPEKQKREAEEFRLRMGRPMTILLPDGELAPPGCPARPVNGEDLSAVLEIASHGSVHTVLEQLKNGFITVGGGHRLGICGSGVVRDGGVLNLRQLSSVAIRIAKEVRGSALEVLLQLYDGGELQNTLIISPPGRGKTTLLRELIRCISDGEGVPPLRIGVADERGELAAMENGMPLMDVGARTDVMDGCPKEAGLLMLLRGMNPQVLAMDEVTAPQDLEALATAAGCGVRLLATAHGESLHELRRRPLYRKLMDEGIFRRAVIISMDRKCRRYQVLPMEGEV